MKAIITLLIGIIIVTIGVFAVDTHGFRTIGLSRDLDYVHPGDGDGQCMANSPECGVCDGKVINRQCYVNRDQYTDEQLYYKNLGR